MSFYDFLIFIHVSSAILGLGPGFVMIYIVTKASTMTELRHAYYIRNRVHVFVMVGGTSLIVTGIWMGLINTDLFQQGWYITSLILYLVALAAGPVVLRPKTNPIRKILNEHPDDDIPAEYFPLSEGLFFYERITNLVFLIIIALMILKPF